MVRVNLFLSTLAICFSACFNQSILPSPKANLSEKLRTDGFYYRISKYDSRYYASVYFLYQNGIFRYKGSKQYSSVVELKSRMNHLDIDDTKFVFNDGKYAYDNWGIWGVYQISEYTISMDQQVIGRGQRMFQKKGIIIKKDHFYATGKSSQEDGYDKYELADHYYFIPTTSKPDSLNEFFK